MAQLHRLTLGSVALAAGIFFFKSRPVITTPAMDGQVVPKEWLTPNAETLTPVADRRPPDQTFLTFPEWFLVFSPEEQAAYFAQHTSTSFPFLQHVSQFWRSYAIMKDQTGGNFPPNPGYHLMICVIGASTTVEYAVKSWYEVLIGRITDTGDPVTGEDRFNARYAADYVAFIKDQPWYAFDFKRRLEALWTDVGLSHDHPLRALERRYLLTTELLVKWGYGKLIGFGTKEVYGAALPTTAVVLDDGSVRHLPRYDRFAGAAMDLASGRRSFQEIAGNRSAILVTILVPANAIPTFSDTRPVFTQVITSDPTRMRIALATPVASLASLLRQCREQEMAVEHIFDF